MESPSMLAPTANVPRSQTSLSTTSCFNRYYILLKIHYFLFFAAFGMLYPILNITLRSRGLSNTELSYINIIIPFLVFFTNPLLGFIADKSHRYLSTFNFVVALVTILYTAMFFLPTVKTHNIQANIIYDQKLNHTLDFCASQEVATKCASRSQCGCSYQANCTSLNLFRRKKDFFFTFSMNSKDIYQEIHSTIDMSSPSICGIQYRVPVKHEIEQYKQKHHLNLAKHTLNSPLLATCEITCSIAHYCHGPRNENQLRYILLYSLLFILGNNFLSNAIPLGASIGIATLDRPDIFGEQRVFGTIGFGVSAFLASRVYHIFKTEYVYIIMFSITTIICIIITAFIPIKIDKKKSNKTIDEDIVQEKDLDNITAVKKKQKSQSHLSSLLPLLKKVDVIVFLLLTFIWGMPYAGLDPYLYLYVDEIAACKSHSIVGWMSLVSAAAEVVGFFLAGRVLKLLGTNIASVIILLAFTIRFGGYYYILQPYFLIAMETMHFFNFGILYVLIVQKADSIAPPGLSGTLQGVALGITFGLGRGVGLLISSFIYTLIGQRLLFLLIAVFNLIAAIIFTIYFFLNRQRSKTPIEKTTIENDAKLKEEPLLVVSTSNQTNEQ